MTDQCGEERCTSRKEEASPVTSPYGLAVASSQAQGMVAGSKRAPTRSERTLKSAMFTADEEEELTRL